MGRDPTSDWWDWWDQDHGIHVTAQPAESEWSCVSCTTAQWTVVVDGDRLCADCADEVYAWLDQQ